MKNIQVGDIVRVKDDPHRYVVSELIENHTAGLASVIDNSMIMIAVEELELVEGIERAQRGDTVQDKKGFKYSVYEVCFNSFAWKSKEEWDLVWLPFQEAKDWKIVRKEEEGEDNDYCIPNCMLDVDPSHKHKWKEEEEPKEHSCFLYNETPVYGGWYTKAEIDDKEYTIDYILKALKAYEE